MNIQGYENNQQSLRQIAGLNGIIPYWWISTGLEQRQAIDIWNSFKNVDYADFRNLDRLKSTFYDIGEFYGIVPNEIYKDLQNPNWTETFVSAVITANRSRYVELQCNLLSNYRLWVNGEIVKDRWDDSTPLFENGHAEIKLLNGSNVITLELPTDVFKGRCVISSRIYNGDGNFDDVRAIGTVKDECFAEKECGFKENCSPFKLFARLTSKEPKMRFNAANHKDFTTWKLMFKEKLKELLGELPEIGPLNPEVSERVLLDGVIREKVWIQTEKDVYLPLYIHIPEHCKEGKTIIALHGHGNGKDDVAGLAADESERKTIDEMEYDYALRFAQKGYITITPDFRCFGERKETLPRSGKDHCDADFIRYVLFGDSLVKYDIFEVLRVIDYALTRKEVDAERIGLTGLSFGGRMTMFVGALDERIKVCVSSGSMNTFKERVAIGGCCGSQFLPGLLRWGDTTEIFGLIAPTPLLLQIGTNDDTSPELYAAEIDSELKSIYGFANCENKYAVDIFHSGHKYNFKTALEWFDKWL